MKNSRQSALEQVQPQLSALLNSQPAERLRPQWTRQQEQTAALAHDAGVGTLIATHFSSRYDAEGCQRLLAECQEIFPSTVLAEDFMVYTVE